MKYNRTGAENTVMFLQLISNHLASRKDCADVSYRVIIETDSENKDMAYIYFWPQVYVYPDIYSRKPRDRISLIEHILKKHCPASWYKIDRGKIQLSTYYINVGKYVYAKDNNYRKWVRV